MSFPSHYDVEITLRAAEIHVRNSDGEHMFKQRRSNEFWVSRVVNLFNWCLRKDDILSEGSKDEIGKHDSEKQD